MTKSDQPHDPPTQNARVQLLAGWWRKLVLEHGVTDTDPPRTQITMAQIVELATDAALVRAGLDDRPVAGLVRALDEMDRQVARKIDVRVSGSAQERDLGTVGYLRAFVVQLVKHVTRFLEHPGTRLAHHSEERDLSVVRADVLANGEVMVTCIPIAPDDPEVKLLPLSELWPAGPVSDAVRIMVRSLAKQSASDAIQKLVAGGVLKPGGEVELDRPGVDELKAHPSYVVQPDGSTKPDE